MGYPLVLTTLAAASNESFLTMACAGLIGLLFGVVLTFFGYRLVLLVLPIWGFLFGLGFGAQAVQSILGDGFLATTTSWVVGFVVACIFAGLAYLFWFAAVAIASGSFGYSLAVGLLMAIGFQMGLIVWLVGVVAFVVVAFVALGLNLQKWIVEIATAILGAGTTIGVFILLGNPAAEFIVNPVQFALQQSPFLMFLFFVLAGLGIAYQALSNRKFEVNQYNRWETATPA